MAAVPAAAYLKDNFSLRKCPGEQDGIHCGQCAAGGEPHLLRRSGRAKNFSNFRLSTIKKSGLQFPPTLHGFSESFSDLRRVVTQDIGVVPLPEFQDVMAVYIGDICSPGCANPRWEWVDQALGVAAAQCRLNGSWCVFIRGMGE